jgi:hypothetical protein
VLIEQKKENHTYWIASKRYKKHTIRAGNIDAIV